MAACMGGGMHGCLHGVHHWAAGVHGKWCMAAGMGREIASWLLARSPPLGGGDACGQQGGLPIAFPSAMCRSAVGLPNISC
eukprot:352094-Chlamydomonas_euryale.AAC.1